MAALRSCGGDSAAHEAENTYYLALCDGPDPCPGGISRTKVLSLTKQTLSFEGAGPQPV